MFQQEILLKLKLLFQPLRQSSIRSRVEIEWTNGSLQTAQDSKVIWNLNIE